MGNFGIIFKILKIKFNYSIEIKQELVIKFFKNKSKIDNAIKIYDLIKKSGAKTYRYYRKLNEMQIIMNNLKNNKKQYVVLYVDSDKGRNSNYFLEIKKLNF
ncbi:MAG: hypothetical protein ACLFPL_04210 [Candidatus Nanoarchaeia archaeon]